MKNLPDQNYVWPEFKTEGERIKFYSKKYKNSTLANAFNEVYGVGLRNDTLETRCQATLKVGQMIRARIQSISKGNVVFDSISIKEPLICRTNLHRFKKFQDYLPLQSVDLKVIEKTDRGWVVDPMLPIFEGWLNPILKDPTIQYDINEPQLVYVEDLKLVSGGFLGKVKVDCLSEFVGEDQYIEAFIPGSQIVLNIESNFERWIGKTVPAFISNYIQKPGIGKGMSLICSTKQYLKYLGDLEKIDIFKAWSDAGSVWDKIAELRFDGVVTGVINSAKKCGVFVEIPEHHITGMVAMKPDELVNYKPGQEIIVKITGFEEEMVWNRAVQQMQHAIPYRIENNKLRECTLKPILKIV